MMPFLSSKVIRGEPTQAEAEAKSIIEEAFKRVDRLEVKIYIERHGLMQPNPVDFSYFSKDTNWRVDYALTSTIPYAHSH